MRLRIGIIALLSALVGAVAVAAPALVRGARRHDPRPRPTAAPVRPRSA